MAQDDPLYTADVDETPRYIRYGAAVLLGLVAGVGTYVAINDFPSAPQQPYRKLSFTDTKYSAQNADIVNPFAGTLDPLSNLPDATLREAAIDESIEPISPADYAMAQYRDRKGNLVKVIYLFNTESSNVPNTDALNRLADNARRGNFSLDVSAYTDEHGRPGYNQRLSERRAHAIGDYLIAHGIPAEKISYHAMGPTHAFADDAHDRRAEVVIVK